jgi:hypothetical protein
MLVFLVTLIQKEYRLHGASDPSEFMEIFAKPRAGGRTL